MSTPWVVEFLAWLYVLRRLESDIPAGLRSSFDQGLCFVSHSLISFRFEFWFRLRIHIQTPDHGVCGLH